MRKSILRVAQPILSTSRITTRSTRHLSTSIPNLRPRSLQTSSFYIQRQCQRLYSTEQTPTQETNTEGKSTTTESEGTQTPSAEDGARMELETAKKEIIELKVYTHILLPLYQQTPTAIVRLAKQILTICCIGQIPPLHRRLPQPPRPHETRTHIRSRLCNLQVRARSPRQRR